MKLSAILTIANRSPEVCQQVADSLMLPGNMPDELVIVLDRPTPEVRDGARAAYERLDCPTRWVTIPGKHEWRSPVKAWNLGFLAASGDVLYCFSSETVQAEGNLERAKSILVEQRSIVNGDPYNAPTLPVLVPLCLHGSVSCSCGPTGTEVNWGGTAPGNLFGDAAHPRPLGFIWAAPAWAVKQINGYDEGFAEGFWYDDDDFFFRLWQTGLDFVFDDSISGIHLHHERKDLGTPQGQAGIQRNNAYMATKYREPAIPRYREERQPGRTIWRHP